MAAIAMATANRTIHSGEIAFLEAILAPFLSPWLFVQGVSLTMGDMASEPEVYAERLGGPREGRS